MIADVFPYARARLKKMGFTEWSPIAFYSDNIPRSRLNKSYTLDIGRPRVQAQNHRDLQIEIYFFVNIFRESTKDPIGDRDDILALVDQIVLDFCKNSNRVTDGPELLNVKFYDADIQPLSKTNDNGCEAKIQFIAVTKGSTE